MRQFIICGPYERRMETDRHALRPGVPPPLIHCVGYTACASRSPRARLASARSVRSRVVGQLWRASAPIGELLANYRAASVYAPVCVPIYVPWSAQLAFFFELVFGRFFELAGLRAASSMATAALLAASVISFPESIRASSPTRSSSLRRKSSLTVRSPRVSFLTRK